MFEPNNREQFRTVCVSLEVNMDSRVRFLWILQDGLVVSKIVPIIFKFAQVDIIGIQVGARL